LQKLIKYLEEAVSLGGSIPIGIDDGFDETKLAFPNGDCLRVQSLAASGGIDSITFDEGVKNTFIYKTSEGAFTAGQVLKSESTAFEEYPMSAMNRVIVMNALRKAGLNSKHDISAVSGLPFKRAYKAGKVNEKLLEEKRKNLLKNDVVAADGYKLPLISSHSVLSEGLAAWFNLLLNRNEGGELEVDKEFYNKRIAIIDIGGKTTDIVVVKAGVIDYERSSTFDAGMLLVKEKIRESVLEEHDVELTNEQLYTAVNDRRVSMYGEWESIGDVVDQAMKEVVVSIKIETQRKLKKAADIDKIVFVGGTVNRFEGIIGQWYKHQMIASNPEFMNAKGMQKFCEFMLKKASKES